MLKTLLLVLAGIVAGLAAAFWLAPSSAPPAEIAAVGASSRSEPIRATADASIPRLAALEKALASEVEQRTALETKIEELASQLEAVEQRQARAGGPPNFQAGAGGPDPAAVAEMRERFRRDPGARNEEAERRFSEQLVAEGFAPDRAEWIIRRTEELRMQALQAQYDAQRGGRPVDPVAGEQSLRTELGEADYERYLRAYGRPTAVPVRDVLASSPAERSGLHAGDEIVAYAGKRVFDMRDLNALTLEGTPGESVVLEVRRDGQNVQLVMPRGPIGITGGGFRGR
ncbi:MAG TPA: PDZ domain-containing protein [Gammaproteobacteria bacterium]|nr:PDZ domain-containing protein [Gammaproteobacteria bacterium]